MMRNEDWHVDGLDDQPGMTGLEEPGQDTPAVCPHDNDTILLFHQMGKQLIGGVTFQQDILDVVIMLLHPFFHFESFLQRIINAGLDI